MSKKKKKIDAPLVSVLNEEPEINSSVLSSFEVDLKRDAPTYVKIYHPFRKGVYFLVPVQESFAFFNYYNKIRNNIGKPINDNTHENIKAFILMIRKYELLSKLSDPRDYKYKIDSSGKLIIYY